MDMKGQFRGHFCGSKKTKPPHRIEVFKALLVECGDMWNAVIALGAHNTQNFNFLALNIWPRNRQADETELDLPGHQVPDGLRCAFVRDMLEINICALGQQFAIQM